MYIDKMYDATIHAVISPPSFFLGGKRESNYVNVASNKTFSDEELFEQDNEPNNLYVGGQPSYDDLFAEESYEELFATAELPDELFADEKEDIDQLFTGADKNDAFDLLLNNDEVDNIEFNDIIIYL